MKTSAKPLIGVLSACSICLLVACGCASVHSGTGNDSAGSSALSSPERDLVAHGKIEQGMGTNEVYRAWGKPSEVTSQPGAGQDETWIYYGNRPVLTPAWSHIPNPNGYGTVDYTPRTRSESYVEAEVHFRSGRVTDWKKY